MNITTIKTFITVVRLRNLNRAAEELNVTQSAVTARLDALDQSLNTRLLNRSRKGATLTKEGYIFIEQAEVIARMWDTARTKVAYPAGFTGQFSLVCDPSLWHGLAENWISKLRTDYSQTAIETWTALNTDAQNWLRSGVSDAALMPDPITGIEFDNRMFKNDKILLISSVQRRAKKWAEDYIVVDYGQKFRTWHAQTWESDESAMLTFSNPEWALMHILNHHGSAYLPERMVLEYLTKNKLFLVNDTPSFEREVFLSWRKQGSEKFPWLDHET